MNINTPLLWGPYVHRQESGTCYTPIHITHQSEAAAWEICEIWASDSLLGTFRLQGITSINGTKWLCGVTLHYWQNGNDHRFTHFRDLLIWNTTLLSARCVFNHQRVTNRTRQRSSLCCACHQQAVSNAVVAADDVTLPHSMGIMLQTPAVLYRPR